MIAIFDTLLNSLFINFKAVVELLNKQRKIDSSLLEIILVIILQLESSRICLTCFISEVDSFTLPAAQKLKGSV
jgi:hypothetical protein